MVVRLAWASVASGVDGIQVTVELSNRFRET
jgi:hypothetical protein